MVKASFYCEMPMVTRGIETRLQILSSKEVHMVRRDGSITSTILYGAGISRYFRGQDGRVVKASFYCEMPMVSREFETRLQILSSKEVHMVRRDGSITSAILYGAGISRYFLRAEWPSG